MNEWLAGLSRIKGPFWKVLVMREGLPQRLSPAKLFETPHGVGAGPLPFLAVPSFPPTLGAGATVPILRCPVSHSRWRQEQKPLRSCSRPSCPSLVPGPVGLSWYHGSLWCPEHGPSPLAVSVLCRGGGDERDLRTRGVVFLHTF